MRRCWEGVDAIGKQNLQKNVSIFLLGSKSVGHSLDSVSLVRNVHERHTRDFADAATKIAIAGGDNVDSIGGNSFNDAIVCIGTLVGAGESTEARVLGNTKSHAILNTKLLQLCHDAVSDARSALCEKAIHHR